MLTKETEGMHPFVELADTTGLHDVSGFTNTGITYAAACEIERNPHKRDKLAILVASDEVYDLAVSYSLTSSYFRDDVRIFLDFSSAIDWLGVADLEAEINRMRQE